MAMAVLVSVTAAAVAGAYHLTIQPVIAERLQDEVADLARGLGIDAAFILAEAASRLHGLALAHHVQKAAREARIEGMAPGGPPTEALLALDRAWVDAADTDPFVDRISGQVEGANPAADRLRRFVKNFPEDSELILTDSFGATLAATGRLSDYYQADEEWWRAAWNDGHGAVFISEPSFDKSAGVRALLVALPVRIDGDGEVIGILRSTFALGKLLSIVRQVRPGTSGWAAIVDRAGLELGSNAAGEHDGGPWILARAEIAMTWTGPQENPFEAEVRESIAKLEWSAVVGQSQDELDAALNAAMKRSLAIGIVAMVLASMLAILVATLMTRRIAALKAAARAIGAGELDAPIPRLGNDDIGVLSAAFGQMAARLRQVIQSLQLQAHDASIANEQMRREIELRKFAELALTDAKIKADAASRAKSHFLANMSHELRTPLNAVIGFSDILSTELMGPLGNPKYKEYAQDIRNSGNHLLQLINDLLDLSKIEAGKMELHEEWLDPREAIDAACGMIEERAARLRLHIEVDLPKTLPRLYADRRLILQVFLNILSNAVKFTPEDGRIKVTAFDTNDGGMGIGFADTGIGIAESDIATVLQPFGQVEGAFQKIHQGTGLGLPLAVSILERHGCRLELQSRLNEGTTVRVLFPASRKGSNLSMQEQPARAADGAVGR